MLSSTKRAHANHPQVSQILSQLRVEMEMMPVPEDAMEARTDVETRTESEVRPVRRGRIVQTRSTWKHV